MSEVYHHHMLVRQEHLNQYGNLFGGRVLAVIDELAFIACARTWPRSNFVTRAVEDAAFTAPARLGDILEFAVRIEGTGTTSVRVRVTMAVHSDRTAEPRMSFDGAVVMVCVDGSGAPMAVPVA